MTDTTRAWDGRPENPERDGWHWVSTPLRGEIPMRWKEVAGGGWVEYPLAVFAHEAAATGWRYLGPALLPAQVAAAVQAEREACAAVCDERVAAYQAAPPTDSALAGIEEAADLAAVIRARGPSPALADALRQAEARGMREAMALKEVQGWPAARKAIEAAADAKEKPDAPAADRYKWTGEGPEPASWFAPDGTKVYRSYEDYCDD